MAYLDSKIEEVEVPIRSRDDVFVDDGHTDGGEAVSQDGSRRAVVDLGQV
jgi:hypothetical protein